MPFSRVGEIEGPVYINSNKAFLWTDLLQFDIVSVLGRDEGYTVIYNPLPKEFQRAKTKGLLKAKGFN